MQEIKRFLHTWAYNGREENWEISIAQISEGHYKCMAFERAQNLSIRWRKVEAASELRAFEKMIDVIKDEVKP